MPPDKKHPLRLAVTLLKGGVRKLWTSQGPLKKTLYEELLRLSGWL